MTRLRQREASGTDVPKDPRHCVVANEIRRQLPWAKSVTVGKRTIQVYDYRCPHNPEGAVGGCLTCPGRALRWSVPLPVAEAMAEFDRTGHGEIPAFELRMDEAKVLVAAQDKGRKREAMRIYHDEVRRGVRKPDRRSPKALARAATARRRT